jgi:DnaK suppressor protein
MRARSLPRPAFGHVVLVGGRSSGRRDSSTRPPPWLAKVRRECLNYPATGVPPRPASAAGLRGRPLRWPTRYAEGVDPARARQLLAAERERIERDLAGLAHPDEGAAAEADEFDAGDLGRELLQDELDEGRREDLEEQLAAVERAEQRLAAGTYGLSVQSGEPISDERLEAVPTAELTVAEADEEARRLGR